MKCSGPACGARAGAGDVGARPGPGQALVSFHCPVALTGSPELASRVCPISETQPPVSAPPRGQSLRGFLLLLLHRGRWRKAPERVTVSLQMETAQPQDPG